MKFSTTIGLALVLITSLFLFACGGGGSSTPTPTTPTIPSLTADKMTAVTPVLNGGTTTISYNFGTSVADGTVVTYTVSPSSAVLSGKSNVTGGIATVVVTNAAQANVTVTASIAGATGSKLVQFIPQPDKVVVHVATTKTISNLAILTFGLRTNPTIDCPYTSTTLAPGYTGFNSNSSFLPAGGDLYSLFIFTVGFNTTPSTNFQEMTFTPAVSAGIPFFEVFQVPNNPQDLSFDAYTNPADLNIMSSTNLAPADFVLTTGYYLGTTLLATN